VTQSQVTITFVQTVYRVKQLATKQVVRSLKH